MLLTHLTTTRNGATKRSSLIAKLVHVDRQYSKKNTLQRRNLVPNQLGSGLLAPRRWFPHYQSSITLKIAKHDVTCAIFCR